MIQIQRQIKKNEAQRAELRGKAYQLKANLLQVLEPSMRRGLPEPQDSKVAAKSGTTSPHSDSLDTQALQSGRKPMKAEPDRVPEPSMRLAPPELQENKSPGTPNHFPFVIPALSHDQKQPMVESDRTMQSSTRWASPEQSLRTNCLPSLSFPDKSLLVARP